MRKTTEEKYFTARHFYHWMTKDLHQDWFKGTCFELDRHYLPSR
ncbi:MAG TPA: hypothetical protein VFC41_00145 [Anaerovoracaceae bacterium]|nr:hypothetical protein [Anaerovoracaceae bacterium]